MAKWISVIACALGAIGVGIGALGAHGLPGYLATLGIEGEELLKRVDQCKTAVHYQMLHALAMLVLSSLPNFGQRKGLQIASWLMLFGVLLFSGGLYSLVFLNRLGHWAIIPLGGSLMIGGWVVATLTLMAGPAKREDIYPGDRSPS